ncbi:hypothetical protein KW805_03015 [Candidatus Pacearchaeota archaeon]|nr:hypothetical protein [Candidatus Pacearchaeota archaeon]
MKRGQVFLIAALIIASIAIGLVTVYNSTTTTKANPIVYALSDEITFEGSQVINYGVLHEVPKQEISQNIKELASYYSSVNPDKDIVIVYGNQTSAEVVEYANTNQGGVSIDTGGTPKLINIKQIERRAYDVSPHENRVKIDIVGIPYEFTLKQGENFYIVIKSDTQEETTVAQG